MSTISYLKELEAESIYILREVASQFERPVILYSVGKDSSVVVHLARKAFAPMPIPFPLLHIDTGYEFPEVYTFRDEFAQTINADLRVYRNEAALAKGTGPAAVGTQSCCGLLRTEALVTALKEGGYDAAIGGARRDEERSRAKERIFSLRNNFGQWDPKNQRPELWNLYNGQLGKGEHMRVFPISNWTELDVWTYIYQEEIPVVPLYFSAEREYVNRNGQIIPLIKNQTPLPLHEPTLRGNIRFRTLGCTPCSGAILSHACTVPDIIREILEVRISERAGRVIDYDADGSMERKKREGYF